MFPNHFYIPRNFLLNFFKFGHIIKNVGVGFINSVLYFYHISKKRLSSIILLFIFIFILLFIF